MAGSVQIGKPIYCPSFMTFVPIDFLPFVVYTDFMKTKMPEKTKMVERRHTERRPFSFYMRVLDDETEETVGHLVEVGPNGFGLETTAPLPPQKEYHLHMELTPEVSDRLFMFISARTKWCKPDTIMPNLYRVGFQIMDMAPHDRDIYQRLLETYTTAA